MSESSNVLSRFQDERARQDREWERVFAALGLHESNVELEVARNALDDVEAAFGSIRVCRALTNGLRA